MNKSSKWNKKTKKNTNKTNKGWKQNQGPKKWNGKNQNSKIKKMACPSIEKRNRPKNENENGIVS